MPCHQNQIAAPVLKSDEHTHTDFMDSCFSHTVKPVEPPLIDALHALRMVLLVSLTVIGLLETYHSVKPGMGEAFIERRLHWHDLESEIMEIWAAYAKHLFEIIHTAHRRVLARHDKKVLEGAELFDRFAFGLDLIECQGGARERIVMVETAVHALVGAHV